MLAAGEDHPVSVGQMYSSALLCCKHGDHKLNVIYGSQEDAGGVSTVVRWCSVCGAVVVDTDVDGRTRCGDVMKMKASLVAQAAFDEFKLSK